MKVKVQSKIKHVNALTGLDWREETNNKTGEVVLLDAHKFRQFQNGFAYMSPEEAAFLVEGVVNRMNSEAGDPIYWYPLGMAVPVADDHEGPLTAPLTIDMSGLADPRAADLAEQVTAAREAAIAKKREDRAVSTEVSTARGRRKAADLIKADAAKGEAEPAAAE